MMPGRGLAGALLLCVGLSVQAASPDTLSRIGAQIDRAPVIRAEFEQTKQMAALKRPLAMSGRLIYAQGEGVIWQIEKPYRVTYVLGDERVAEISADGTRREKNAKDIPGLAQIGRVFRAMIEADTARLGEYFEIDARTEGGRWEIALTPRQQNVGRFFSEMRLSGARYVERIAIAEAGGDSTIIRLIRTQGGNALDSNERQIFGRAPGTERR